MELNELMSAFAETLGIDGIEVKDGVCSMTIDDIPMDFTESPGGEAVIGAAVVGEPPPDKREAFYEMLLQANTQLYGTQGIALGISQLKTVEDDSKAWSLFLINRHEVRTQCLILPEAAEGR